MNVDGSKYKCYLFDLGFYIKERALKAKEERNKEIPNTPGYEFQCGRIIAFNEVISIMQQCAKGFDIPLQDLNMKDIEPDRDFT
ncbi:MAG: hypothetical protein AB1414_20850 [bacterium]